MINEQQNKSADQAVSPGGDDAAEHNFTTTTPQKAMNANTSKTDGITKNTSLEGNTPHEGSTGRKYFFVIVRELDGDMEFDIRCLAGR
jgi:hypothetical protein